jgi:hypothetical protein
VQPSLQTAGKPSHDVSISISSSCSLTALPAAVLAHIMRWMTIHECLTGLSQICRALQTATAAYIAGEGLHVHFDSQRRASGFSLWLGNEANTTALQHLKLGISYESCSSPQSFIINIPWHNLRSLQRFTLDDRIHWQPATNSSECNRGISSNPFTALMALTSLVMYQCNSDYFGFGLSQLAALSALQQLQLQYNNNHSL